MSRTVLVIPGALLASALATQAFAQEGKYDAQYCVAGPVQVIAHADGYIAGVGTYVGVSPNVFPEQTSWRCTVAWAVIGDQVDSGGTCEFADAAGDKGFGVWSRKGDVQKAEGVWHMVHGTGKFAGMSMDGKFTPIAQWSPQAGASWDAVCNHGWGTYSKKSS